MSKNFVEELRWRGMLHDAMPGTEEHLAEAMRSAYIGFDPTSDSLHIGSLAPIMILSHFQRCGHQPVALVGGATGMIGDPTGKSKERNLLDEESLRKNQAGIKKQLSKFLDFDKDEKNAAVLVNNYDWMKDVRLMDFICDIGKHITVNYMMAKDSVKKRFSPDSNDGMSFTEFTYQLVQGYDFLHLFRHQNCSLQMGGSDQWGNITTGTELIRRIDGDKGFALTCALITKADGSKFGKSEGGNIWLDRDKTSPYKFYQYWLNTSDEDAEKFIKIFTFLEKQAIDDLIDQHREAPHKRILQKKLAEEVTELVHSKEDLDNAQSASAVLFGKTTADDLRQLDETTFLEVFDGIPQAEIAREAIQEDGLNIVDALAPETDFLKSKGEARRALKGNAVSVNKEKVDADYNITETDLINKRYIILNNGKKKTYIIKVKE